MSSFHGGSEAAPAEVHPYDPAWAPRGRALAEDLETALGPLALRADHIGSTAIPGMAAKRVFDLQVSVADLDRAAEAFDRPLAERGFEQRPFFQDHVPAAHDEPPERWAKRLWIRRDPADDAINLHVRVQGAPNERLALLFRDWFRAHPRAVPAYSQFKSLLSAALPDLPTYAGIKDPVVDVVIVAAEEWAGAIGWTP
jgi:GrpB-like predicted nucleotidyltransferase (UPF0157 family)